MDDRSELCSLKIFGIKALVKSYLPIKDFHLRLGFANPLKILKNVLAFGEILKDMESSPVNRAHMRLASTKAVLRLSKDWDHKIPIDVFHLTLRTSEIIDSQVKKIFLGKVHQYIKDRVLDPKYACAILLSITGSELPEFKDNKHSLFEIIHMCHQAMHVNTLCNAKSKKFKKLRSKHVFPYTGSRRGYARLENDMKKKSTKPSSVVRVDVWEKAHTKANGEPSNEEVAKNLVKIEELKKSLPLNSIPPPLKDDMLSQVLGPERQGRVRALGFGVTTTRLGIISQTLGRVAELEEQLTAMMGKIEKISSSCPNCVDLPEDRLIVLHAFARKFAVLTVSSVVRCWSLGEERLLVKDIIKWWIKKNKLEKLPLMALGDSSGGYSVSKLATDMIFNGVTLMIAEGVFGKMNVPDSYPPALFVHMPKDRTRMRLISENIHDKLNLAFAYHDIHLTSLQSKEIFSWFEYLMK
ncbi:hypothetical protein GIB67_036902 [Kingdonia uniflora]|uniref:Uncharacterized protein n=1 Tax=Kingdonia uniflora TaxID=39325 RepID=A0A7J7NWA3_9MAGN|nr:hypothetical protein GIB67_036902 [Kingdonia uniflora]